MSDSQPESLSSQDEQFVQDLAWKMLDERLDDEEAEQLALLLLHSEQARRAYVQVVQLHVGLLDHFGALPNGEELIKKLRATLQKTATETKSPPADEIITTQPTGAQS